jgi:ABC-type ATPase involved in cell division
VNTSPDQSDQDAARQARGAEQERAAQAATRDIADVPAVEVITTTAVHLMSATAVKLGLADDPEAQLDLDEARKLINALAWLNATATPEISSAHAAPLRDGLRSLQLAFREASPIPDPIGKGPGEKWTGPVS